MMNEEQMQMYVSNFKMEQTSLIDEMEQYAAEHHVPIMESDGIETFIGLLALQQPKRLLELGSAIGYSAIRIAQAFPKISITTIERDAARYEKAVEYIEKAALTERIHIIKADALEFDNENTINEPFDAMFIDAAKGQYKRFFEKYASHIAPGGVIYCDNMFMHGMVFQDIQEIPRRKRTMIRNLTAFTSWVMAQEAFDTHLLPVGDGILIAIKKEA